MTFSVETSKMKKPIQQTVFLMILSPKGLPHDHLEAVKNPYLIIASDYTLEEAFSTTILTFHTYVCNVLYSIQCYSPLLQHCVVGLTIQLLLTIRVQ